MMSKEMESKILSKIEKLISEAGEGSYIAMAFEGCVDDARENIKNDWGCSMKQRAEAAEKHANDAEAKIKELEQKMEQLREVNTWLKEDVAKAKNRILSHDDTMFVLKLLTVEYNKSADRMVKAQETIIEHCDNPNSDEIQNALEELRVAKLQRDALRERVERISKLA